MSASSGDLASVVGTFAAVASAVTAVVLVALTVAPLFRRGPSRLIPIDDRNLSAWVVVAGGLALSFGVWSALLTRDQDAAAILALIVLLATARVVTRRLREGRSAKRLVATRLRIDAAAATPILILPLVALIEEPSILVVAGALSLAVVLDLILSRRPGALAFARRLAPIVATWSMAVVAIVPARTPTRVSTSAVTSSPP